MRKKIVYEMLGENEGGGVRGERVRGGGGGGRGAGTHDEVDKSRWRGGMGTWIGGGGEEVERSLRRRLKRGRQDREEAATHVSTLTHLSHEYMGSGTPVPKQENWAERPSSTAWPWGGNVMTGGTAKVRWGWGDQHQAVINTGMRLTISTPHI